MQSSSSHHAPWAALGVLLPCRPHTLQRRGSAWEARPRTPASVESISARKVGALAACPKCSVCSGVPCVLVFHRVDSRLSAGSWSVCGRCLRPRSPADIHGLRVVGDHVESRMPHPTGIVLLRPLSSSCVLLRLATFALGHAQSQPIHDDRRPSLLHRMHLGTQKWSSVAPARRGTRKRRMQQ